MMTPSSFISVFALFLMAFSSLAEESPKSTPDPVTYQREIIPMSSNMAEVLLSGKKLSAVLEGGNESSSSRPKGCPDQGGGEGWISPDPETSAPQSSRPKAFLEVELALHVVTGADVLGGSRVPYRDLDFNSGSNSMIKNHRTLTQGMSFNDAMKYYSGLPTAGNYSNQDIHDSLMRDRLINSNPSDRRALLREMGNKMSFSDQMRFIAKLGAGMDANYDDARAKASLSATAMPDCDAMLTGLGGSEPIGVCRDIVVCQAAVLYHMGNKDNCYAASYPNVGNYHVTLMCTDPNNRNSVHKLSYGRVVVDGQKQGSAALSQDQSPDMGTIVRVWKPVENEDGRVEGRFAGALPSELGLLLERETNPTGSADPTGNGRFDPFTQHSYSVTNIGGGYGPVAGRVFAAKLSNGDEVYGVAANVSWGSAPDIKGGTGVYTGLDNRGHIGLAYARRSSEASSVEGDRRKYETNNVYLSVHQRVAAPLKLSEHWTITPYTDFHLEGVLIEGHKGDGKSKVSGDGNISMNVGGKVEYDNGKTRVSVHGHSQLTPGLGNIQGLTNGGVGIYQNYAEVGAEISQSVSPEARLNASLLCAFRTYGDTCAATIGASIDSDGGKGRTAFGLGILTPITETQQPWMPGGARTMLTAQVDHQHKFSDNFMLGGYAQGGVSLEDSYGQATFGLSGRFDIIPGK